MPDLLKHLTTCLKCRRHFCTDEAGTVQLPTGHYLCCNHKTESAVKKVEVVKPVVTHPSPWSPKQLDRLSRFINEQKFDEVFRGKL